MDWFGFALLSSMVWAGTNVVDKFFLTRYVKSPFSYQILCALTNMSLVFLIPFFTQVSLAFPWFLLCIIASSVTWAAFVFYNKAVMSEEVSRVIPLMYLTPIFILPLAIIFLNEVLNLSKYLGVLLLVAGAILVSYRKLKGRRGFLSPTLKLILIVDLVIAFYEVIIKYILGFIDYWSLFFWNNVGGLLGVFLFFSFRKLRKDFLDDVYRLGKRGFLLRYLLGSSLYLIGAISFYFALSIGPVSLVSSMGSIQPFFVLIYATILTFLIPKIFTEKIDKSTISLKLFAIFIIFLGTWLVAT